MRLFLTALALVAVLWPATLRAQTAPLYEASVPVADQSVEARDAALRDALAGVLVKLTGDRAAPARAELAPLLDAADRHVQQFRYERRDDQLHLRARFDAATLQRLLVAERVPVWGRERPATLVWLAFDDGLERGLADDAPPELQQAFAAAADARGLPVVWPLLDLQDRGALPFADLWGGFDERVLEASARYPANAVLVGRVYRTGVEEWAARWTLYAGDARDTTDTGPGMLADAVAGGAHWVADSFAARDALVPDAAPDGRTRLVVGGVDAVGEYASVMRYLGSLSPVSGVALEAIDGDELVFALELRGTPAQLQQAIALGTVLTATPRDSDAFAIEPVLRYGLRR